MFLQPHGNGEKLMTIEALSGGQSLFQMMGASGAGRQGPPTGHDVAAKLNEAISSGHVDGAEFQSRLSDRFLARRMLRVFFRKTVRLILKNYPVFWKRTCLMADLLASNSSRDLTKVNWCRSFWTHWKRVTKHRRSDRSGRSALWPGERRCIHK